MPATYHAEIAERRPDATLVNIGFGPEPAQNDRIVPDAILAVQHLDLNGGGLLLNGACSVPAAMAFAHQVAHRFRYVAMFDPKIDRYVVAISHDPAFTPGQLLE